MPAMIAYDVLVQTIADWKSGARPTAPMPPAAPEAVEELASGVVDLDDEEDAGQYYAGEAAAEGEYEQTEYEQTEYESGGQDDSGEVEVEVEQGGDEQGEYEQPYEQPEPSHDEYEQPVIDDDDDDDQ